MKELVRQIRLSRRRELRDRAQSGKLTNMQKDMLRKQAAILEYLEGHDPMTTSQMISEIPELFGESVAKVAAMCHSLA